MDNTQSSINIGTEVNAPGHGGGRVSGGRERLPDHLVRLPNTEWALWRCVCLRSAGFAAADVLQLSSSACAAAADRVILAEEAVQRARSETRAAAKKELGVLKVNKERIDRLQRDPLLRVLNSVNASRVPDPPEPESPLATEIELLRRSERELREATSFFRREFDAATAGVSAAVRKIARDRKFSEAMIWQNRQAYKRVAQSLLSSDSNGTTQRARHRKDERLIASYLQRYCVKNESIGFFGPIGWANWHPETPVSISVRPGPDLTAERGVFFEGWGIDALAELLAADPEIRKWASPRRISYVQVQDDLLVLPFKPIPTRLPAREAAVLRSCDRTRTALQIARQFTSGANPAFRSEEEVYRLLEAFRDRGLITWMFEIPSSTRPEMTLRTLLEPVQPAPLRQRAMHALIEMERAQQVVASAAGDPDRLDAALEALDKAFTGLTAKAPTRAEGQTYAARTLVYHDARRDVTAELGSELLEAISAPLSIVFVSARWITYKIAECFDGLCRDVFMKMCRDKATTSLPAAEYWAALRPYVFGDKGLQLCANLRPLFQSLWSKMLGIPRPGWRLQYSSEQLVPMATAAFRVPYAGWADARHHSPDIMIVAESVDAIRQGRYFLVLGEVHVANNTLTAGSFVSQHPAPEELLQCMSSDYGGPKLMMVPPKSLPALTVRTTNALSPREDCWLEATHDSISPYDVPRILIGEMIVEERAKRIEMRTRDDRISFDMLATFGLLRGIAGETFRLLPRDPHTPRVTIDKVVICREGWNATAEQLRFAYVEDEGKRFLAARKWAAAQGIPRFVFLKVPLEMKPMFVDFESVIYVNLLARMIRKTAESEMAGEMIGLTEMLPSVEQSWLHDTQQRKYCCELRMVGLDLIETPRSLFLKQSSRTSGD